MRAKPQDSSEAPLRRLGIISDTHGLLRPAVAEIFAGVEGIIHAGDVGHPAVLDALRAVAPVVAVRGNVDRTPWADALPLTELIEFAGLFIYVIHDIHELDIIPDATDIRVVVSGHSHRASVEWRKGVLYLNPGGAGPRRFKLPVTVALLHHRGGQVEAEIVELPA